MDSLMRKSIQDIRDGHWISPEIDIKELLDYIDTLEAQAKDQQTIIEAKDVVIGIIVPQNEVLEKQALKDKAVREAAQAVATKVESDRDFVEYEVAMMNLIEKHSGGRR